MAPLERIFPRSEGASVLQALSKEDALHLSDEELLRRGYGRRPNPEEAPESFKDWRRTFSTPLTIVEPTMLSNPDISHDFGQVKKNSLIISPLSFFRAALHFFFPTSIPRLFIVSTHSFVVVGLQAAYIHSPFAGILTAARIWPSQDFTLYLLEYTSFGPNQRTSM